MSRHMVGPGEFAASTAHHQWHHMQGLMIGDYQSFYRPYSAEFAHSLTAWNAIGGHDSGCKQGPSQVSKSGARSNSCPGLPLARGQGPDNLAWHHKAQHTGALDSLVLICERAHEVKEQLAQSGMQRVHIAWGQVSMHRVAVTEAEPRSLGSSPTQLYS